MVNILVTGSNGQIGSEFRELAPKYPEYRFFFTERDELDVSCLDDLERYVATNRIEVIINCAGYTAVDKAESEHEEADRVNHLAVANLAQLAKRRSLKLVHISTDYVFNGKGYRPYIEEDSADPLSVYGRTKHAGEQAMMKSNPSNSVIVRTAWVYSRFGANFVKTMRRLARERDELKVVFDQIGSPTYARDLVETILAILPKIASDGVELYHYSNEGVASWYDFAKAIIAMDQLECRVLPIESSDYPTPAARPHYSLLNKSKIKKHFGVEIPYWRESLQCCLEELGEEI